MLSGIRWIIAYLIATLAAAFVIAFYANTQTGLEAGGVSFGFLVWAVWLLVAVLAAPLSIVLLGVPEIFDLRPNYILWAALGGLAGVLSQAFWLATPAGEAVVELRSYLPDVEVVSQSVLYRLTAAAGVTGGFALAFLRRNWLR